MSLITEVLSLDHFSCSICKQHIDLLKDEFSTVGSTSYYHEKCANSFIIPERRVETHVKCKVCFKYKSDETCRYITEPTSLRICEDCETPPICDECGRDFIINGTCIGCELHAEMKNNAVKYCNYCGESEVDCGCEFDDY